MLAGVSITVFHGDEAEQLYMSHDFVTAFVDHQPQKLMVMPPYDIDSDPQLRILNGSVNRYTIGLSWTLAGFSADDLPPHPGWDWGLSYARNVETDHLPSPALLLATRLPSALLLCASIVVLFALAALIGPRWLPYVVTALYTLHPSVLLNGRRGVQEGAMLCFGLLVVFVGASIARRRKTDARVAWGWWLALIVSGALALASKHTDIVFVAAAFGWIFLTDLFHNRRALLSTTLRLVIAVVLTLALAIALLPALWNDPLSRIGDLLQVRATLLDIQVGIDPAAPMPALRRVTEMVTQPFITPPQYYEIESWAKDPTISAEVEAYEASPLSGVRYGLLLGVPLTLLAALGIVESIRAREWGLLLWLALTVGSLLANPLPWARYYLPLIPVMTLLAGLGLRFCLQTRTHAAKRQLAA